MLEIYLESMNAPGHIRSTKTQVKQYYFRILPVNCSILVIGLFSRDPKNQVGEEEPEDRISLNLVKYVELLVKVANPMHRTKEDDTLGEGVYDEKV